MENTNTIYHSWKSLIPENFSPKSRVWIYQCSRLLFMQEALHAESILEDFVENWKSHGATVKGYANIFFGQFVVFMADESNVEVGGCSTDSSVRVVKELEKLFGVNMFDRTMLAFLRNDKVEMLPLPQLSHGIAQGFIKPDTIYFNNLAQTKQELLENWMIPVSKSWLAAKMPTLA